MNLASGTALRAELNTSATLMMQMPDATVLTTANGVRVCCNSALITPESVRAVGHCDVPITTASCFKYTATRRGAQNIATMQHTKELNIGAKNNG